MGKLKYGIATIAIAGIVGSSIPYITKNSIDNSIQQKQNELQKDGIKLNIIKNIGYISSKREVTVKIQDTIKFIDYISKNLEIDAKTINELTNNGSYLENLSIKGTIENTNIFPKNINILLALDELPNDLKQLMRKELIVNKLIKALSLKLKINTNGGLTFISLNDIVINDEDISAKILQPQIIINKNNYLTSIQNMTFKLNERKESALIYLDDIKDNLNYKNSFNLDEITTINKIKFNYKNSKQYKNTSISYESKNNEIKVNSNSKNDELNTAISYKIGNSSFNTNDIDTKIDNLVLSIGFNGLKEQPIKKLADYKNSEAEVLNILEPRLQEIINYGFSMNLESNINNIRNNKSNIFEAKNININLVAKLKRNNLNKNSNQDDIIKNISVNGVIKMDKNIIDLMKPIQEYNTNIINGISNFDIKFIDGKLLVNEHEIK
jgi:hypothetical protein